MFNKHRNQSCASGTADKRDEPLAGLLRKGQGMVEFALAIPIVLFLTMGIIEGGRMLFMFSDVYAASREAARYGAGIGLNNLGGVVLYNDCNGILGAAKRVGAFAGVKDSNITIDYDSGPESSKTTGCPVGRSIHRPFSACAGRRLAEIPQPATHRRQQAGVFRSRRMAGNRRDSASRGRNEAIPAGRRSPHGQMCHGIPGNTRI